DASAPHRAVVLAPARVDELAPTLSAAQCLLDKRLVRQLFGKVHSLLCHARPQPEWYVAPLSGFGFVPKQLWRASTGAATWLLRDEPQPLNFFPLLLALLHGAASRQGQRSQTPELRQTWDETCDAMAADIAWLGGWLFRGDLQGHR